MRFLASGLENALTSHPSMKDKIKKWIGYGIVMALWVLLVKKFWWVGIFLLHYDPSASDAVNDAMSMIIGGAFITFGYFYFEMWRKI